MNTPRKDACLDLTEKEKLTLRMIVRGHDAKSIARNLGLSVHTINERLRDARRKMAVSSSREAARLLQESESGDWAAPNPHLYVDTKFGEDASICVEDQGAAPIDGVKRSVYRRRIIVGVFMMTFVLGLLALTAFPQLASNAPSPSVPSSEMPNSEAVDTARQWLTLVDQGQWKESYEATGAKFRKLNTAQVWAATSAKVRAPLGATISRTIRSDQWVPAPPLGYEMVKFQTSFANKANAIETVSLDREHDSWRVVGVMIE